MKLRERLFGKADKEKRVSGRRMSPLLQAMSREIPRWPPQHQRILERIVIEASAAGVSSMEDFSAFMSSHPNLRAGYEKAMLSALGSEGKQMMSAIESLETPPPTRVTIPGLDIHSLNVSDPEEMGAYAEKHPENIIKMFSHILEEARTRGDRMTEVVTLGELGLAHARLNQLPKAIYCFERHLEISRELGNWQWEMEDYRNLGRAHLELGDKERARSVYEDALLSARRQDDRQWIINHSYSLAGVCAALGDIQRAAELTNSAKVLSSRAGR
jgi:tetratricopeptide (TPR) repeat protein